MKLITTFFILFIATVSYCEVVQKDLADSKRLKGVWKVITAKDSRGPDIGDVFVGKLVVFDSDMIAIYEKKVASANLVEKLAFKVDPGRTPKEINLYSYLTGKKSEMAMLGVYAMTERGKLQVCWNTGKPKDQPRPTGFELDIKDRAVRRISLTLERANLPK